jgi:HEPN domain-containing protein
MNFKVKINYWLDIAVYDLKTAQYMHKSGRYLYTIFLCQQAIEKIFKALYIQKMHKDAPFTHNLVYLQGLVGITFSLTQQKLLAELNAYYIEGRYPSYKNKLSTLITKRKSAEILKESRMVFKCIKSEIK